MTKTLNKIIPLVIGALMGSSCLAQPIEQGLSASLPMQSAESGSCLIWKISKEGADSYIMGSLHIADKRLYPLDPRMEEAFQNADLLLVEANTLETDQKLVQEIILSRGVYLDGTTIQDHISERTFTKMASQFRGLKLDPLQFNLQKPWLVSLTIINLQLVAMGYDQAWGIDNYFLKKAIGSKEVFEIEGIENQLAFFDELTEKEQDLFLFHTLIDLDDIEEEVDKLIEAWKRADLDTITYLLTKDLEVYPEIVPMFEKIIYGRNDSMFPRIVSFLESGKRCFVVVGIAHLIKERGLLNKLKGAGYKIEQL